MRCAPDETHVPASDPRRPASVVRVSELKVAAAAMLPGALLLSRFGEHIGFSCPLRDLTGIPCPLCGMTTSAVATVHGRWGEAIAATPAGIAAVAVAVVVVLLRGDREIRIPGPVPFVALAVMWLFQLFRYQVI